VEAVVGITFGLLLLIFVTLGSVLIVHFRSKKLTTTSRALLGSMITVLVMLGPVFILTGLRDDDSLLGFSVGAVMLFAFSFPIAFLSIRKLNRQKLDIAGVFE